MKHLMAVAFAFSVIWVGQAQAECPTPPLFEGEALAQVTPGEANNVRDIPSASGELVGQIPGEGVFQVLGGVSCDERFTWIEVAYADFTGWTVQGTAAERFVEPLFEAVTVVEDERVRFAYPVEFAKGADDGREPARAPAVQPASTHGRHVTHKRAGNAAGRCRHHGRVRPWH